MSKDCKDLINQMLKTDPQSRISMKQILVHPWIETYSKKLSLKKRGGLESLSSSLNSLGTYKSD